MTNHAKQLFKVKSKTVFIFVFTICLGTVRATDERSIRELRDAIVGLGRDVDPREAEVLSITTHTMARSLAREYRIFLNPSFQNLMINIGARERGYCAHYARDIGSRLKELNFKTLVLHWGAAYAKTPDESNCLVVTARNQPFHEGIVLDAWRKGGRLFWCQLKKDREYEVQHGITLNQLGGHPRSGITAWKEDLQETAWLQEHQSGQAESKRD